MSDFWSFYEMNKLVSEAKFVPGKGKIASKPVITPTTTGETEADPVVDEPPTQAVQKPVRRGEEDVLAQIGPRANKLINKNQERKALEQMPEGELKTKLAARLKAGRDIGDKITALNDINGNWLTGYWATMNTVRELGYQVPDIPMDATPRWVPQGEGYVKGDHETNGGSPDGPYVTINQDTIWDNYSQKHVKNPYVVKIDEKKHLRKILKAAMKLTATDKEDRPERDLAAELMAGLGGGGGPQGGPLKGGMDDIDMQAGSEGEHMQDAEKSVGLSIKNKPQGPSRQQLRDAEEGGGRRNVRTRGFRDKEDKLEHDMNEWLQYSDMLEVMYA